MHIRRAATATARPVDMPGAKGVKMNMMVGRADGAPNFAMRHFAVDRGGFTPRHSHDYEHEVFVLKGAGRIEQDGEFEDLRPGDVVFVRPNATHQFVNTGEEPFEFLCLVPVSFDCGKPTPNA